MRHPIHALLLLLVLLATGCASTHMVRSTQGEPTADSSHAPVVFMRPSGLGGGVQSSVYQITGNGDAQEFLGIVSSGTKIAYEAAPGRHLFMVIAENADFMDAELEAGKTYYVLVSPRIGIWKARFSLLPIHDDAEAKYSLRSERFSQWQRNTEFVEKGATANQWYRDNLDSINSKRIQYLQKWNSRTAEDKADLFLHADDGI